MTWVALVVIAVGSAVGFLLDQDANPVVQGLLAVVATVEVMLAVAWWRSVRRRDRR
jgi:membrane protein implicated in regulation of membrane protease activity